MLRLLIVALAFLFGSVTAQLRFNVTAIAAENGLSTLECWEMDSPFYTSDEPGNAGARVVHLGNVSTLSWIISLPGQYVGLQNAPQNQWVVMIKGFGHVGLPHGDSAVAYIAGGEFGLMFAADTAMVSRDGHISRSLGATESVVLHIPTQNGMIPEHTRLHMGPCTAREMGGWNM